MQTTLRHVPPELDRALKARARELGKSVNQLVLETLAHSLGQPLPKRVLRNMPGAWSKDEAAELDRSLEEHRTIDQTLWE